MNSIICDTKTQIMSTLGFEDSVLDGLDGLHWIRNRVPALCDAILFTKVNPRASRLFMGESSSKGTRNCLTLPLALQKSTYIRSLLIVIWVNRDSFPLPHFILHINLQLNCLLPQSMNKRGKREETKGLVTSMSPGPLWLHSRIEQY